MNNFEKIILFSVGADLFLNKGKTITSIIKNSMEILDALYNTNRYRLNYKVDEKSLIDMAFGC